MERGRPSGRPACRERVTMKLQIKGLELSEEMWAAIDAARGSVARGPWLERFLRTKKAIKDGAAEAGVTLPERPAEGRGKWKREKA